MNYTTLLELISKKYRCGDCDNIAKFTLLTESDNILYLGGYYYCNDCLRYMFRRLDSNKENLVSETYFYKLCKKFRYKLEDKSVYDFIKNYTNSKLQTIIEELR